MPSMVYKQCNRIVAFLHFFDVQFLELKRAHLFEEHVKQEARLATKFALLCADEVLIPAASFFETRVCRQVILELRSIFDLGMIWLVGAAANMEEFIYRKLQQYDANSEQYQVYSKIEVGELPPFRTRFRSATRDIKAHWLDCLNRGNTVTGIIKGTKCDLPKNFERRWERVPVDLEERAFIVKYVAPLLLERDMHPTVINRLHYIINEAYFSSYVEEFEACTVSDLIYLASPHSVPSFGPRIPFKSLLHETRKVGLHEAIVNCSDKSLVELKKREEWIRCMLAAMPERINEEEFTIAIKKESGKMDNKLRSFIVHGHDDVAKLGLKDYLQNILGLPEPLILHQRPNQGRTVIEKFEEYSERVDVAFILLTPDDIAGLPNGEQRERARQNVILELGVFVGKFGRKSGRVLLLHKGDLEIPSDLAGVIYIDISNGIEAAGEKIRKELTGLKCLSKKK